MSEGRGNVIGLLSMDGYQYCWSSIHSMLLFSNTVESELGECERADWLFRMQGPQTKTISTLMASQG